MIVKELYSTREDGVRLFRTYSDASLMIRQVETGAEYAEAIDVETASYTYVETDTPIPEDDGAYLSAQEALNVVFGEEGGAE